MVRLISSSRSHGYVRPRNPTVRAMTITPISIQKMFRSVYAASLRKNAHHVRSRESHVLMAQTNMKGLSGPSQLTKVKLEIRMRTPIISKVFMWLIINAFMLINLPIRLLCLYFVWLIFLIISLFLLVEKIGLS
ncbi:hypothetical protein SAMN05428978_100726 [Nitrosomonas sp. Nm34]|nr:hypothetical protein SAMN05428978_100726 [Nitrosomonas sp. Nm34]